MRPPPIDTRDRRELSAQTAALAERFSGWRPATDGQPDAGDALIGIFGRFAELVVERLNRAPERSYLAFLNLVGTPIAAPQPARAPLTFTLAEGAAADVAVPAGTQVAAADDVVFETEQAVVVTRALLDAVYVADPETDTYSDRTAAATGQVDTPFPVFNGNQPSPHRLFVACDPLLTGPGTKNVTVVLRSPDVVQWRTWPISWAYWDGAAWRAITPSSAAVDAGAWRVTFAALPQVPPSPVFGTEAGWLRAQLDMPLPVGGSGLVPESVAVGARPPQDLTGPVFPFGDTGTAKWFYLSADEAIAPGTATARLQVVLATRGQIDPARPVVLRWTYKVGNEWRPLTIADGTGAFTRDGEISFQVPTEWPREMHRTRIGRWLRVEVGDDGGGYRTAPQIGSVTVSYGWDLPRVTGITVRLNEAAVVEPVKPPVAFLDATPLDLAKDFYPFGQEPRFNDTCYLAIPDSVARPGATLRMAVSLTNPAQGSDPVKTVRTEGKPALSWEVWDGRAWSARGLQYAMTASAELLLTLPATIAQTTVAGEQRYWLRARLVSGNYGEPAGYTPSGNTFTLTSATFAPPIVRSLTFTATTVPQTELTATACVAFNDFVYASRPVAQQFVPFTPGADRDPALYLGFDRPFDPRPVSLYLQVEPPAPSEVAADRLAELDLSTLARIVWEYASPSGWRSLGALDETGRFAARGLVHFPGPADLTARERFGLTRYWLRARWSRGQFPFAPRLRRVLPNTMWAAQAVGVTDEILGASNGDPNQTFVIAQSPVQPGEQVLVREQEQDEEIWVRWQAVEDFYGSQTHDRHYTLDRLTGDLRFGDGRAGLIPPQGQGNIRVTYRTGGGVAGNRPAGTITELRTGIPYIDSVTNHEPAQGGAPTESVERLTDRGSRVLRHGDRAVTAQDLEDLAFAASAEVARVTAITPSLFDPTNLWLEPKAPPTEGHVAADAGRTGIVVVPASDAARPAPSLGLLREIVAYLLARCPVGADVWVAGPEWVRVTVTATVVPVSVGAADAAATAVRAALARFLHPLTGGPAGEGWAFGRKPHRSDLYPVIEGLASVDHVRTLSVSYQPDSDQLGDRLTAVLNRPLSQASTQPPAADLQRWLARALVYSGEHVITLALEAVA